jgi:hypothetical protein
MDFAESAGDGGHTSRRESESTRPRGASPSESVDQERGTGARPGESSRCNASRAWLGLGLGLAG